MIKRWSFWRSTPHGRCCPDMLRSWGSVCPWKRFPVRSRVRLSSNWCPTTWPSFWVHLSWIQLKSHQSPRSSPAHTRGTRNICTLGLCTVKLHTLLWHVESNMTRCMCMSCFGFLLSQVCNSREEGSVLFSQYQKSDCGLHPAEKEIQWWQRGKFCFRWVCGHVVNYFFARKVTQYLQCLVYSVSPIQNSLSAVQQIECCYDPLLQVSSVYWDLMCTKRPIHFMRLVVLAGSPWHQCAWDPP